MESTMKSGFDELRPRLIKKVRLYVDFPRKGIQFRDILPVLQDPALMSDLCKAIADHCRELACSIDAVVALEARGFLFGPQVALDLGVPLVPVRKRGKLPGPIISTSYVKEYGKDELAIQQDVLKPGMSVLIFDDLIATGGSLRATVDLVRQVGAKIGEVFVIVELKDLKGREKLQDVPVTCLLQY